MMNSDSLDPAGRKGLQDPAVAAAIIGFTAVALLVIFRQGFKGVASVSVG